MLEEIFLLIPLFVGEKAFRNFPRNCRQKSGELLLERGRLMIEKNDSLNVIGCVSTDIMFNVRHSGRSNMRIRCVDRFCISSASCCKMSFPIHRHFRTCVESMTAAAASSVPGPPPEPPPAVPPDTNAIAAIATHAPEVGKMGDEKGAQIRCGTMLKVDRVSLQQHTHTHMGD